MMMGSFLSKARLRRDVPAAALWRELAPEEASRRLSTSHRLLWTLFADSPDRRRDFLWREAEPGTFYILSDRPPSDSHGLFELSPPKAFAPILRAGDRLRFSLRANATVSRAPAGSTGRVRGKPCDVVMDALYRIPAGRERAEARSSVVSCAGLDWLAERGERHGYRLERDGPHSTVVAGYQVLTVHDGNRKMRLGILDYEGELVVADPVRLVEMIRTGIGRAKAFGCGLLLIRRA